jgi:hypothetical protein
MLLKMLAEGIQRIQWVFHIGNVYCLRVIAQISSPERFCYYERNFTGMTGCSSK